VKLLVGNFLVNFCPSLHLGALICPFDPGERKEENGGSWRDIRLEGSEEGRKENGRRMGEIRWSWKKKGRIWQPLMKSWIRHYG